MPVRPFLMLYRNRFAVCVGISVLTAVAALMLTSAESPTDFGVLWHHFCGCAPDMSDARTMLFISTAMCFGVGIVLGFPVGAGGAAQQNGAAPVSGMVYGEMRFLLTRPVGKIALLLTPIILATAAIVVLPATALLLLLAWLRVVHAPALGHLVEVARLIPSAAAIGDHPSLMSVLSAIHYARYYAASVSVGICFFAVYYAQRWWMQSQHKWLRVSSIFVPALLPTLPGLVNFGLHDHFRWILMMNKDLSTPPSALMIGLHLLFAAVCLGSCWRIARRVEV